MKQVLAANQLRLTKSLGQNFLHDQNQLRRIVGAAELSKDDKILEVGPGLGSLTQLFLATGAEVLAIEKDLRLYRLLEERSTHYPKLTLVHADALDFFRQQAKDWSEWKLVANLPYSVASPLLVSLAQANGCPLRLVATLQAEVAGRLLASAGNRDYGVLTLLLQLRYEARGWFKIPAACFFPVPHVDSACVTLVRRNPALLPLTESRVFERIVKRGFSQRRKVMMKLLKEEWPTGRVEEAYGQLRLASNVRAETVSLDQFVQLSRLLPAPPNGTHEG